MKITIYGDFYYVLARKSEHFPHMLCTIILWKNCLTFHGFPSMFCGGTLTNAPSASGYSLTLWQHLSLRLAENHQAG